MPCAGQRTMVRRIGTGMVPARLRDGADVLHPRAVPALFPLAPVAGLDAAGPNPDVSQFRFAWPPAPNVGGASRTKGGPSQRSGCRASRDEVLRKPAQCLPCNGYYVGYWPNSDVLPEPPAQAEQFSWRLRSGRTPRPADSLRLQITECRDDPTHPSGRKATPPSESKASLADPAVSGLQWETRAGYRPIRSAAHETC